jgi:heme exporter protein C
MRRLLPWLLWLWIGACVVLAYLGAPRMRGFMGGGESGRIVFFHVPMAWTAFVAFVAGGVWSARYLAGRDRRHDLASAAAIRIGLVFCVLATLSGSVWARVEWGAFWNWDPRQISITMLLVYYAAYVALRGQIVDHEVRARITGAYSVLGLVVAPFLLFVLPRMFESLHPEPVVNQEMEVQMDPMILWLMLAASLGFMVLFFWMHSLATRLAVLEEREQEALYDRNPTAGRAG